MQKREEIFESFADDPQTITKVAGVIKHFHPRNSIGILENITAFRKQIDQALQNKLAEENEEAERELSGFELLCFILGEFLNGAVNEIIGDEFEQIDLNVRCTIFICYSHDDTIRKANRLGNAGKFFESWTLWKVGRLT